MAFVPQSKLFLTRISSLNSTVRTATSRELRFAQFGDPIQVIEIAERQLPTLGARDVQVRMLAAPVNPVDINIIQGKYPLKPVLPNVPGTEGVGIVTDVGRDVKKFTPSDKVIILGAPQGTWRDCAVFDMECLKRVPNQLGLVEAATLAVNPCTAYRMLSDFKPIRKNKELVVIQNGANGSCGQNVIQMCKAWGIKSVNVVRNRPDIDCLKQYLLCLGATYVLTEEELVRTHIFNKREIDRPVLGLNCVGGPSSKAMLKHMDHSGIMVTYGGMSRQPVTIPTSSFIFKNISAHGFWMTAWNHQAETKTKELMFAEIINLICEGRLKAPVHKIVPFDRYREAIRNTLSPQGYIGCKYILDLSFGY